MATQLFICPKCGCPDILMEKGSVIVQPKERKAECPNCDWKGTLAEAGAIFTQEKVFDLKQVLNLLLHVTTKHAAGPLAQALEFIGLIEKDDVEARNTVMRAALEGMIRDAFAAAAEHAAATGKQFDFADTDISKQNKTDA